jgi:hypothetical protein
MRTAGNAAVALAAIALLPPIGALGAAAILVAAGFGVAAALRPGTALSIVAALYPLAPIALPMINVQGSAADGILLAVVAGAFVHATVRPSESSAPRGLAFASAAFALVVFASLLVQTALEAALLTPAR